MVKLSFDLNVHKDSSNTDEAAQNGGNPESVTFEIHHARCFTPIPSMSYVDGKRLRLGLDYGLHPLNVDANVLEMAKYVKDNKIILVYVEHGSSNVDSSIFVTPKKGVAIAVDNHLRKDPIEINSSPNSTSSVEGPIIVESANPFNDLDEILGDYANTREEITKGEITRKQMIVHVGNNSTVDDVLDLQMLFEIEEVGPIRMFKEVEVDVDTESEEESDTEDNDTSGSDSEDLDYDPKHDEVFDDDEHIVEDVYEHDLDVIDYNSVGSDLDDGIDSERRIQLRELRRISKQKTRVPICQILTAVGVDANNEIYPVSYAIVETESKAS
ncbi:hypothetical protein Tco_1125367 [Tanacetum coccineum]|uniref:Uncharacterized protein n=1 Tax=Tanacetum coccineum TaxID=301880 RepID=A0ABQ5J8T7_9ASTR